MDLDSNILQLVDESIKWQDEKLSGSILSKRRYYWAWINQIHDVRYLPTIKMWGPDFPKAEILTASGGTFDEQRLTARSILRLPLQLTGAPYIGGRFDHFRSLNPDIQTKGVGRNAANIVGPIHDRFAKTIHFEFRQLIVANPTEKHYNIS